MSDVTKEDMMAYRRIARPSLHMMVAVASSAVAVAAGSPVAVTDSPTSPSVDKPARSQAGDCTSLVLDPRAVNVYPTDDEPYEFQVQATVHVTDPARAAGCALRVCVEEELGAGNWHAENCGISYVDPAVFDYNSLAPYVDCENYGGTGEFRSYARFESSTVARAGVTRFVCT